MAIGTALFLIAAGAILRWGVEPDAKIGSTAFDWPVIGLILMIVGALGAAISLFWWRDRAVAWWPARRTTTYVEPAAPATPVVERVDREYVP